MFAVKWQKESFQLSQLKPFQNSADLWVFELPWELNDDFYNHLYGCSLGFVIVRNKPNTSYNTNFPSKWGMREVHISPYELYAEVWFQSHSAVDCKPEDHNSSPGLLSLRPLGTCWIHYEFSTLLRVWLYVPIRINSFFVSPLAKGA